MYKKMIFSLNIFICDVRANLIELKYPIRFLLAKKVKSLIKLS